MGDGHVGVRKRGLTPFLQSLPPAGVTISWNQPRSSCMYEWIPTKLAPRLSLDRRLLGLSNTGVCGRRQLLRSLPGSAKSLLFLKTYVQEEEDGKIETFKTTDSCGQLRREFKEPPRHTQALELSRCYWHQQTCSPLWRRQRLLHRVLRVWLWCELLTRAPHKQGPAPNVRPMRAYVHWCKGSGRFQNKYAVWFELKGERRKNAFCESLNRIRQKVHSCRCSIFSFLLGNRIGTRRSQTDRVEEGRTCIFCCAIYTCTHMPAYRMYTVSEKKWRDLTQLFLWDNCRHASDIQSQSKSRGIEFRPRRWTKV